MVLMEVRTFRLFAFSSGEGRECQFSGSFIPEKTEICAVAEVQRDPTKCIECVGGEVGDCAI